VSVFFIRHALKKRVLLVEGTFRREGSTKNTTGGRRVWTWKLRTLRPTQSALPGVVSTFDPSSLHSAQHGALGCRKTLSWRIQMGLIRIGHLRNVWHGHVLKCKIFYSHQNILFIDLNIYSFHCSNRFFTLRQRLSRLTLGPLEPPPLYFSSPKPHNILKCSLLSFLGTGRLPKPHLIVLIFPILSARRYSIIKSANTTQFTMFRNFVCLFSLLRGFEG
jgi:hypothetical protein